MFHSFSVRLLAVMVILPVIALISVGFAIRRNNQSQLHDYVVARREAISASGVLEDGVLAKPRTLFFLKVPISPDGEVQRQAFSEPLSQFDPVPIEGQPINIDSGAGRIFEVYGDPAIVKALDAQRADTLGALNRYVLFTTALAVLAAIGAAFLLSRSVTRPVEALTAAVRRFEGGDLSQRVHVRSRDEIGELAGAFNAMAERMERSNALRRRMASDVAHELRTPLNNLGGYLDAMSDRVVEPSPEVLALLQREAQSLARLVMDVEQLSDAEAGDLPMRVEPLDLVHLASSAVAAASVRASDAGVDVRVTAARAPVMLSGDEGRLRQVVDNLLDNAIRQTPRGGAIDLTVDSPGGGALLTVEDTGPGIAPAHLPYIFDRFYRADPARARSTGGAGLGLAIARQIVELHGGTIAAGNRDGGGAVFTMSLPAV